MKRFFHNLVRSLKSPRPKMAPQTCLGVESLEDRWPPSAAKFSPIVYVPKEITISTAALADECDCGCGPVSHQEMAEQFVEDYFLGWLK